MRWRTVHVGGARVELLEVGAGEPVLFLPGWGLTARSYLAALLPLARNGLRVMAPSLPGFGSSTPLGLQAPLAAYARRVVALLDVLDPEHPVFATGHSFGGGVALYQGGKVIGGLGVSGDSSCADHAIAYRMRKAAKLDTIPGGVGPGGTDNIAYAALGVPPTGFEQPHCFPNDITP